MFLFLIRCINLIVSSILLLYFFSLSDPGESFLEILNIRESNPEKIKEQNYEDKTTVILKKVLEGANFATEGAVKGLLEATYALKLLTVV